MEPGALPRRAYHDHTRAMGDPLHPAGVRAPTTSARARGAIDAQREHLGRDVGGHHGPLGPGPGGRGQRRLAISGANVEDVAARLHAGQPMVVLPYVGWGVDLPGVSVERGERDARRPAQASETGPAHNLGGRRARLSDAGNR